MMTTSFESGTKHPQRSMLNLLSGLAALYLIAIVSPCDAFSNFHRTKRQELPYILSSSRKATKTISKQSVSFSSFNILQQRNNDDDNRRIGSNSSSRSQLFMTTKSEGKKRLATGMAFLTGWADIALFTKYKTFATMMTGNTMWMALAAVESRFVDVVFYASVIASYLTGTSIFRFVDLSLKEKSLRVSSILIMILFTASDLISSIFAASPCSKWVPIMLLAVGFGIINSVAMEVAGTLTFVITGHMTKLSNQCFDSFFPFGNKGKGKENQKVQLSESDRIALIQNASVLSGFFLGALWGCFSIRRFLRSSINAFPLFSVLSVLYSGLFLWKNDMESIGGAWWIRRDKQLCDLDDDGALCDIDENGQPVQIIEEATAVVPPTKTTPSSSSSLKPPPL